MDFGGVDVDVGVEVGSGYGLFLWDAANLWIGRILVTIAIVVLWDSYVSILERKQKYEQQPQKKQQRYRGTPGPRNTDGQLNEDVSVLETPRKEASDRSVPKTTMHDQENESVDASNVSTPVPASYSSTESEKRLESPTATAAAATSVSAAKTTEKKSTSEKAAIVARTQAVRKMKGTSNEHPGMEGFSNWYEVETSLFRIYTLAPRDPSVVTIPPYVPHSRRGDVSIELEVTNHTNYNIHVFWVDYHGNLVRKGNIPRNRGVWKQSTYIDHPWVFQDADTAQIYLYYVPFRAIPTTPEVSTIGSDGTTALHKFALINDWESAFYIGIQDDVLPFPGTARLQNPLDAINWTLKHMSRANTTFNLLPDLDTLQAYLINVLQHPDRVKYRQLRIASPRFRTIWASPLRGVLLAVGFVEAGPYAELGCDRPLSSQRLQDVGLLSYLLNEWKEKESAA
ncbi:unnamed protein product [Pseudo-nitzschia multistriata]|uniref:von Hippel-Lindau disease tumour suppressor beta domain-containing protein n=1 Tax=Pseudo-nitzschia multistriata TaxID=183589 RepID=A0A448Z0Y9_9STRA|nr:unnamed protein product [Pseudo-nitzschia multistriata]